MRVILTVTAGPHKGKGFAFSGHDTFLVGRSKRAHFQLPRQDKYFSRVHFLVEVNGPHCRLMDMDSRNGTYVNGRKVTRSDLHDGDEIRAGHTTLRFTMEREEPLPEALSARPPANPVEQPSLVLPKPSPPRPPEPPPPDSIPGRPPAPPSAAPAGGDAAPLPQGQPSAGLSAPGPAGSEQAGKHTQLISGYQVVRELGRGGMGVVYLAVREKDGAQVALKRITPAVQATETDYQRFIREAQILRKLEHPNIVGFRDMGEVEGQLFFVMEYVPGPDAGRLLKEHGPLPVKQAVGFACQLLDALAYAHAKGFVHRDIKPQNVLIAEVNGRQVVKLADFGLARVYQTSQMSGLTFLGEVGGTVGFMAPEQIVCFREAQPSGDQYSAAATLYNLLTGYFVFDLPKDSQRQLRMILEEEPVPIQSRGRDIPRKLAEVIHRALAKEPANRFADVETMRQALLPFSR